ncbi:MAG TPA: ABC transporter ATP-binding protein [Segeticoccus sp.]|nr:ABC transporter ATP-binding protein [Segeticoccus sp.]
MTRLLAARELTLGYGDRTVCADLSLELPDRGLTAIVGPNGCGKSTLLKALARTLRPRSGEVLLDGRPLRSWTAKQVARRIALLPQTPVVPEAIRVRDLVGRGRFPHRALLRSWTADDQRAVDEAVRVTGVGELVDRPVAELSGGQRQRVWMAMVLAQDTPVLLLDEPTTFLDLAHQYELMRLCARHAESGRSVVAVLHDLNQAARFADRLVVLREGAVLAQGAPSDVLTAELVERAFGLRAVVVPDPQAGTPMVVPAAG